MFASVFTIIYVLGGTTPDVSIVTGDAMASTECDAMAERARGRDPVLADPVTGRPVIMTFYKCVLQDPDQQVEMWQQAVKDGIAG